jgi:Flp pilus assembly pilin Flp
MKTRNTKRQLEQGSGLTEYALILVLIAIAAITAMTALGDRIAAVLNQVAGTIGGI